MNKKSKFGIKAIKKALKAKGTTKAKESVVTKIKNRTYVAVFKENCTKGKAVTIANRYFKESKAELKVQNGDMVKGSLKIGTNGNVWVVSRREVKR